MIEMMGHRKEVGYITTRAFGQAVLFQVDVPELPEREYMLESPGYAEVEGETRWCPAGTKVKSAAAPPRSCLVASGSLYAVNPCSEAAAMSVIERNVIRTLIALELPAQAALPPAPRESSDIDDDFPDDEDEEV